MPADFLSEWVTVVFSLRLGSLGFKDDKHGMRNSLNVSFLLDILLDTN